jgi:hypothetical protein
MKSKLLAVLILFAVPSITHATVAYYCWEAGIRVFPWAFLWPIFLIDEVVEVGRLTRGVGVWVAIAVSIFINIGIVYLIGRYFDNKTGRLSMGRLKGFRCRFVLAYFLLVTLIGGFVSLFNCLV